jgi:hypothetical protein
VQKIKEEENYDNDSDYSVESVAEEVVVEEEDDLSTKSNLIRITRSRRIKWDLFTMMLALWNALSIPFFVAFRPKEEGTVYMFALNTVIDLIFCFDIGLNFYTTYIDSSGEEVLDQKKIIKKYMKRNFWIDLVASIPIDNFILMYGENSAGSETALQLSDLLKLIRILRLGRIIRFMRAKDTVKSSMRLGMLVLYLLLWVHFTACIWWIVVSVESTWVPVPDFFTGESDVFNQDVWTQYFTCFYHAVWLLVGGEIGARNTTEAAVGSIIIITGALLNAIMFGEISVLMSSLNRK